MLCPLLSSKMFFICFYKLTLHNWPVWEIGLMDAKTIEMYGQKIRKLGRCHAPSAYTLSWSSVGQVKPKLCGLRWLQQLTVNVWNPDRAGKLSEHNSLKLNQRFLRCGVSSKRKYIKVQFCEYFSFKGREPINCACQLPAWYMPRQHTPIHPHCCVIQALQTE